MLNFCSSIYFLVNKSAKKKKIYQCLLASPYSVFWIVVSVIPFFQGRQEDAEEYLGFILNGLHEEMLALKKLHSPQEESKTVW